MRDIVIGCFLIVATAIGWYHFYVGPRDVMLNEIIACMEGDQSREAYEDCATRYIANKQG
jgi:hypothetical protein